MATEGFFWMGRLVFIWPGDLIWVRLALARVSQIPSALITAVANGLHNFSFY